MYGERTNDEMNEIYEDIDDENEYHDRLINRRDILIADIADMEIELDGLKARLSDIENQLEDF